MNLETSIRPELWVAVKNTYLAQNYTGAILDGVHFISDLIRNKSGLDSDGHSLVGEAFGGKNPIIKINRLRTESEREEQRGFEFLLRGIYTAIRNPRSHEKYSDPVETADVMLLFFNFIIGKIDKAQSPFDLNQLLQQIFDRFFPPTAEYADLLVRRIPPIRRFDVAMQVLQYREQGNQTSTTTFLRSLVPKLNKEERLAFWKAISDEFETASTDSEFIFLIRIARKDWIKLSSIARLRAEHRITQSVREGRFQREQSKCYSGILGTWVRGMEDVFKSKAELINAIVEKLESQDQDGRDYFYEHCFGSLRKLMPSPSIRVRIAIKELLRNGDHPTYLAISSLPDGNWTEPFKAHISEFESKMAGTEISDEDIPF